MARKTVNPNKISEYNLLHTINTRMIGGVSLKTLYLIKETEKFYISSPVWAFCASDFKIKKSKINLSIDIPILKDESAIKLLEKNAWHDWVDKELKLKDSETEETIGYLNRILPNHKKVYFYEFESIINAFTWGIFKDYNTKAISENTLSRRKNLTSKYIRDDEDLNEPNHITELYNKYRDFKGDCEVKTKLYCEYRDKLDDYIYENYPLDNIFKTIGENSVCYPVIYSKGTADWHKESYGKVCPYAHAGEIFFIATEDTVYFSIGRHF